MKVLKYIIETIAHKNGYIAVEKSFGRPTMQGWNRKALITSRKMLDIRVEELQKAGASFEIKTFQSFAALVDYCKEAEDYLNA